MYYFLAFIVWVCVVVGYNLYRIGYRKGYKDGKKFGKKLNKKETITKAENYISSFFIPRHPNTPGNYIVRTNEASDELIICEWTGIKWNTNKEIIGWYCKKSGSIFYLKGLIR